MKKATDCKELALKKVNITGNVIGKFGTFEIEQTFINNTKKVLEVGYTFPIVETATIVGFEVIVGDKVMRGKCKEKGKAKKEYQKNIVKGNSAYLLDEESDNIFAITIGKLAKNEEVTVKIKFIDKFEIVDNQIQVIIPTLVPPKYKSQVTARLQYGEVKYNVDFNINIPKALGISNISSATHELNLSEDEKNTKVEVIRYDMSSDFKLNLSLKEELSSNAFIAKNREGEDILYFSFMPEILDSYEDTEKNYIFLIDVSGSMYGEKLEETKHAVIECLKQLDEGDKFNIIAFESDFESMSRMPVSFNERNLEKAIRYVKSLRDKGGTKIFEPLQYAIDTDDSEKIILLFTDGEVGNEEEIISYVEANIERSRIFPFGIDMNVNTFFIKGLAEAGQGKAELIMPGERIDDKIIRTFARIQTPLLEDLTIDYGKNKVIDEIRESKSLFNYEFYNGFVKVEKLVDDITLKGHILDNEYSWKIKKEDVVKTDVDLEVLFAKEEINRLEEYIRLSDDEDEEENYKNMIVEISEKYNINSKYTSFLTVYEREKKIFELPQYQQTTLSSKNTIHENSCACFISSIVDMVSNKCESCDEEYSLASYDAPFMSDSFTSYRACNIFKKSSNNSGDRLGDFFEDYKSDTNGLTPDKISTLYDFHNKDDATRAILKEKVEELMQTEKPIYIMALYLLYLLETKNNDKALTIVEHLKNRLDEARQDEDCMKVLLVCYIISQNSDIYNMLRDNDKNNDIDVHIRGTLSTSDIEEIIRNNELEENLDNALLYLTHWRFIEMSWQGTEIKKTNEKIQIPDFLRK